MRYALELHARGRQIVDCEIYDRLGNSVIPARGFITSRDGNSVTVCVPTSSPTKHKFSTLDTGDGFGYQGTAFGARGWRIPLAQLTVKTEEV